MARTVRRVVTGHDANGKAIVFSDGPAPFVQVNPLNPDWISTDIWRTHETPAKIVAEPPEPTLGPRRQMPTKLGSVVRINQFPPETKEVREMDPAAALRAFQVLGNEKASTFGKTGRHPLMHRTETIDYAIVLKGEIVMLLDDTEVTLKAGDVLVQVGTNHAWVNRSKKVCEVAFILLDGSFDPALAKTLA